MDTPHTTRGTTPSAWSSPITSNTTIDGLFNNLNALADAAAILAPRTHNIPLPEEPSRVGTLVPRYTEDPRIGETTLRRGPAAPYDPEPSDNNPAHRQILRRPCRRTQTNMITRRTQDIAALAQHHRLAKEYLFEAPLPANPYKYGRLSSTNQLKVAKLFTIWNAIEPFEEFKADAMGNMTYLNWKRWIVMDWMNETSEDWVYPCINCHLPCRPWCI